MCFNTWHIFLLLESNCHSGMTEAYITPPAYEILISELLLKHIQSAFVSGVAYKVHVITAPRLELPSDSFGYFKMPKCWKCPRLRGKSDRVLICWHVSRFPNTISWSLCCSLWWTMMLNSLPETWNRAPYLSKGRGQRSRARGPYINPAQALSESTKWDLLLNLPQTTDVSVKTHSWSIKRIALQCIPRTVFGAFSANRCDSVSHRLLKIQFRSPLLLSATSIHICCAAEQELAMLLSHWIPEERPISLAKLGRFVSFTHRLVLRWFCRFGDSF